MAPNEKVMRRLFQNMCYPYSSCPTTTTQCDLEDVGDNPNELDGALVGGPDEYDVWVDDRSDYIHNDVSIDYNAGLQGALAGRQMFTFFTFPYTSSLLV